MSFKNCGVQLFLMMLLICLPLGGGTANPTLPVAGEPGSQDVQLITAEELKGKLARNERVTIIDVRSTNNYAESTNKIKGSVHVKLRRLQSRLTLPPLKDVPRVQEIITYCACPSDEASIAARRFFSLRLQRVQY